MYGWERSTLLFHQSISCFGDFLHIHSSSNFVVFQCRLLIPQLHFWMSLICRRFFFIIANPFSDGRTIQVSLFFSLVIRVLSLGCNPVTVDENVDVQAVNIQLSKAEMLLYKTKELWLFGKWNPSQILQSDNKTLRICFTYYTLYNKNSKSLTKRPDPWFFNQRCHIFPKIKVIVNIRGVFCF